MSKINQPTWHAYLRTISLGSGHEARCAKVCQRIGGVTANAAVKRMSKPFMQAGLSAEDIEFKFYAIKLLDEMHRNKVQTHIDSCSSVSGWVDIGNGCHQRATMRSE